MASPIDSQNPYRAPHGPQALYGGTVSGVLPGYTKAMAIVDLVFCCLRMIAVAFSVLGYFALAGPQNPLLGTALAEIASGLGISVFGVTADILILLRKPAGLWLGMIAAGSTIGSMAVAAWQSSLLAGQFAPGTPERATTFLAMAFTGLVRLVLLGLYVGALVQFANWSRRHTPSATTF